MSEQQWAKEGCFIIHQLFYVHLVVNKRSIKVAPPTFLLWSRVLWLQQLPFCQQCHNHGLHSTKFYSILSKVLVEVIIYCICIIESLSMCIIINIAKLKQNFECFHAKDKRTSFMLTLQPVWPDKNCQMSIKVAQKWFH